MSDFVKRKDVLNILSDWLSGADDGDILDMIKNIPTAERTGEWLYIANKDMHERGDYGFMYSGMAWQNYECSNCGHIIHNTIGYEERRTNYCQNCGARMEAENDKGRGDRTVKK